MSRRTRTPMEDAVRAAHRREVVTVQTDDGRAITGRVTTHPTDPELIVVRDATSGRALREVYLDEVAAVTSER
jgi:hypothetical protein